MKTFIENTCRFYLWIFAAQLSFIVQCSAEDLVISNFSPTNYGAWQVAGTAFNLGSASGELLRKLEIENARNSQIASSEIEGDTPRGSLTSPTFKVERKYISFGIAGGDYERHTCLNLLINGKIVKSATGRKSDRLMRDSWEVSSLLGHVAQVQIVDEASGDWGHINVDHIIQTDQPEQLPVVTEPLYHESLRPQFHFTARQWTMNRLNPVERQEGWLNDLNGLIYYDGEYHLFAQRWAKCWIHAVSRDLIHWTELAPAFWEEQLDSGVQSGTCVIDYQNTSGLSPDKTNPAMIAFWPRFDNRTQCLSYSLDHGRTWLAYDKNPILVYPERDPKVFWYAPSNHWVMLLYGESQYHIFTSTNLLSWHDEHHPIKDSFECPDFFELPVDGNVDNKKWVLIQGNGNYSIGTFNGTQFKEETSRLPCDVGPNFYATQTWHNTDTGDGRRIQTAWMREPSFPNMPFNQQVSFPCELTLHSTTNGLRVYREPISEIALLHQPPLTLTNQFLSAGEVMPLNVSGQLFHLKADVIIPPGTKLIFSICGVSVVLNSKTVESGSAPVSVMSQVHSVEILADRASVEVFVNHGEISSTRFVLPQGSGVSVKAEGGSATLSSLTVFQLNSAWQDMTKK